MVRCARSPAQACAALGAALTVAMEEGSFAPAPVLNALFNKMETIARKHGWSSTKAGLALDDGNRSSLAEVGKLRRDRVTLS